MQAVLSETGKRPWINASRNCKSALYRLINMIRYATRSRQRQLANHTSKNVCISSIHSTQAKIGYDTYVLVWRQKWVTHASPDDSSATSQYCFSCVSIHSSLPSQIHPQNPSHHLQVRGSRTRKARVIDMLSTPLPTSRRLSMLYDADPLRREKQQEKLRLQSVPLARQRAGLQLLSRFGRQVKGPTS